MADLVTITTDGGKRFTVARDQAQRFLGLLNDIELRMPLGPDSGGYANRHIAGTSTPSRHATGHAVDVNWGSNPEGPSRSAITKYLTPQELAGLEETHGLEWGGRWNRPFRGADTMHWESPRDAATAPLGSPASRLPASAGLNEAPEQGLAPLSLLPAYRSPFVAPASELPRQDEAPRVATPPKPPAPEPVIAAAMPPPKESAVAPFAKAAADVLKPPTATDSGFSQFHNAAVQAAQKTALEWAQRPMRRFSMTGAA